MYRKLTLAATSIMLGTAAAIAVPAAAQAAPAPVAESRATATWQSTGEHYSTKSACEARRAFFMKASNVYDYRCVLSGGLWGGQVLAD
ncbi:hypothetical protein [Streptomyces sp. PTD5-9]|uniref:hypothetical protein n=1 Tax=Streptomyces sp. PTD5-9 TaxID=3120150 RepID=UPI00300A79B8